MKLKKKKITLDDILKEPDKYQDLLKNKTFKEIPEFFSSTYLKKYNENTKDHFDKFFGRKYGEHKEEFIRTYSYQEFFETYKNDDKRELFNLYIKADGKLPIENKLINNINENCKLEIDEIVSTNSIFSKFKDNNYENFFKIEKDASDNHLKTYFDKLKENFEENLKKDSEDARGDYSSRIIKLNTPKEFKEILYKYGKYFVNENDYKTNNSPEKFYNFIRSDKTLINKIISYYNIYIILSEIYIVRDSIIYSFKEFEKELNSNKYRKIKKIIPCTQLSHISFNDSNKLKCYFNVEFENINNYSVVRFNTNLINIEKKIIDNNKTRKKYINYGIKLFDTKSNKKEISIQTDINLDSLKYDFNSLLNKNIELFKTKKPKNIKEIFFDNDLFNYVTSKYYKKTNDINSFLSDLVYKIFFYKNPENILYNNKFYIVDNVKIINPKEFKENKDIIRKFKERLKEQEASTEGQEASTEGQQASTEKKQKDILINSLENEFPQLKNEIANYINKNNKLREDYDFFNNNYLEFKTPDKRLSIDKKDNRYEVFLDVICFIKNSLDEKISLKKRMSCNFDCYNSANNLDKLFKVLMKQYFDNDSFKRMLNPSNKGDINLINNSSIKENIKEDLKQDIKEDLKEDIKEKLKQDIKEDNDLIDGGKKIKKKYNYYFKKNNNKYVKKTLKHKNKKNNTLKVRKLIKYYLKNY